MSVQSLSFLEQNFYPCLIPLNHEMYVKNSSRLKNVQLCEFLQEMDNQERAIQNKPAEELLTDEEKGEAMCRREIIDRSIGQIIADPIAGFGGGLLGLALGPIGVLTFGGLSTVLSHSIALNSSAKKHSGMDAGRPRINRLVQKIERIREKKMNLDHTTDQNQLNIAEDYLRRKVDRYNFLKNITPTGGGSSTTYAHYDKDGNYHIQGAVNVINEQRIDYGNHIQTTYTTKTHNLNQ
ncbi:hypothetical protein [Candidatus Protochlamydia phocaeensis]|uniref:hypothetical protein n=1 Tax=Candidatus Protochlamydia phocaeensis TaxID=1414722 RepID=UPI0008391737|nr:hypothetical protein [Candidatus Protochlamydia phocaeensis]